MLARLFAEACVVHRQQASVLAQRYKLLVGGRTVVIYLGTRNRPGRNDSEYTS